MTTRSLTRSLAATLALATSTGLWAQTPHAANTSLQTLQPQLAVGDAVFIRVPALPFRKVAEATNSWTNHVGIVTDVSGPEPVISESKFPLSGHTTLSKFVARSAGARVAVVRLNTPLSEPQQQTVRAAAQARYNIHYDTGFDLHSRGQFCSRYVHEVWAQATGATVGEVETFSTLLARNPSAGLGFWRVWYFGAIPWARETVTPASLLTSPAVHSVFDGVVG